MAVIQGWYPQIDPTPGIFDFPELDAFRHQTRVLYVGANDVGLWQGARRDDDETKAFIRDLVDRDERFSVGTCATATWKAPSGQSRSMMVTLA